MSENESRLVPTCLAIDCAVDTDVDPNPNKPEDVRDSFVGTEIYVHARMTGDTERMMDTVKRLLHPELKLVIHPNFIDLETAERNYFELDNLMSDFYGKV